MPICEQSIERASKIDPAMKERCAGVSLIETIVVLTLSGLLLAGAATGFDKMGSSLKSGQRHSAGLMREARALAMASSSAYRVKPAGASQLIIERADTCSSVSWTVEPRYGLSLPDEITLTDTTWTICFNSRGMSTGHTTVTLQHDYQGTAEIQVLLGGTTRVIQ